MAEFHVVDLASQAHAVARYTAGWPRERVLAWLGQFGQVAKPFELNDDLYTFLPPCGLLTGFILQENGEFYIIGDHTTHRITQGSNSP